MKRATFGFLALALISLDANASWYQQYCSNGEGTYRWANGHSENYLKLTERTWGSNGPIDRIVELADVEVEVVKEAEQFSETTNSCKAGNKSGIAEWKEVSYKFIRVKKADGSAMPENLVGRTKDGLAVEAHALCELNGNSMVMCSR